MSKTVDIQSAIGTLVNVPGVGIVLAYGSSVPADGSVGYATGCLFINTGGDSVNTIHYGNIGNVTSCNFDAMLGA